MTYQIFPDNLIAPTLNLNGTSPEALLDQLHTAATAMNKAITAFAEATPHGRDFITAPSGALDAAREAHSRRMLAMRAIHSELMKVAADVAAQTTSSW